MKDNPLKRVEALGQSIWIDYIRSDLISSGRLKRMIDEDGIRGMTSNPAIFKKAIAESDLYDRDIHDLAQKKGSAISIYEELSQRDVRNAADAFAPVYEKTAGKDGYVSLEVNPHLAHDAEGTIAEARRLRAALDRPNVLIKVPATEEGLVAIRRLIGEGISVNATLLFGLPRYRQVAEAYLAGLETRVGEGKPIDGIASVASFFLSRIDVAADPVIKGHFVPAGTLSEIAKTTHGQVAISSAKEAYRIYREISRSARFRRLFAVGARPQRLLWASTGAKDPEYSDVKYVDAIIGRDTVNTAPLETIDAYRDHGDPESRLERDFDVAAWVMGRLPELGIDMDALTQRLEGEGIGKFAESFDDLMDSLQKKAAR